MNFTTYLTKTSKIFVAGNPYRHGNEWQRLPICFHLTALNRVDDGRRLYLSCKINVYYSLEFEWLFAITAFYTEQWDWTGRFSTYSKCHYPRRYDLWPRPSDAQNSRLLQLTGSTSAAILCRLHNAIIGWRETTQLQLRVPVMSG